MSSRTLVLPGYGESAAMVAPFTDVLGTMIDSPLDVADYYGHERRQQPREARPSRALAATALRHCEEGEPLHLVAHSYGGVVAKQIVDQLGDNVKSVSLIAPAGIHPDTLAVAPRFTYDLAHLALSSMHDFAARQILNIVKSPVRSTHEAYELATQDGSTADAFDPDRTLIIGYQNDRVFRESKLTRFALEHELPLAMPRDENGATATHSQLVINPTMTARTVAQHIAAHEV